MTDKVIEAYENGMSYGLIFTDFSMPVMNGIDATKQIRKYLKTKQNIPRNLQPIIIGITGHVQEAFQQQGIDAGMDLVQCKPFFVNNLMEIIKTYGYKLK